MVKLTAKQQAIKTKFIRLWHAKYSKSPTPDTVGIALSLIAGELQPTTDDPQVWPASGIVPLLRQAVQE